MMISCTYTQYLGGQINAAVATNSYYPDVLGEGECSHQSETKRYPPLAGVSDLEILR